MARLGRSGCRTCRRWRVAFAAAALAAVAGLALADTKPTTSGLETEPIDVAARPISSFDRSAPATRRFGRLEFLGGLELTSPSANFGGWSGIVVDSDGRRMLAVSDAGSWMTADIVSEGGRPVGLANAKLGPIEALKGASLKRERDRDAEAVTLLDGTLADGTVLIAFEQNRRIGRFPVTERGLGAPVGYLKLPADAARMRSNKAFEAVGVLKGGPSRGSVVAFAERFLDSAGNHTGWVWLRGEPQRFGVRNIAEYDLTDTAALPDGGLLLLERRFRWLEGVKMRIRRLAPDEIRPGVLAEGEVLIESDMGQQIDNMEAIAVHAGPGGATVVTVMSDDNFNSLLQRTLLLQFRPIEDGAGPKASVRP